MNRSVLWWRYTMGVTCLVILVVGVLWVWQRTYSAAEKGGGIIVATTDTLEAERSRAAEEIEAVGAFKAYAQFKERYAPSSENNQHLFAHIFGDMLYQKSGIAGIAVCDERFGFGCYHSFFGRAIAEQGIDIIDDLDRACADAFGNIGFGCVHGIGHGILAHLGSAKIDEALSLCASLSWKGVFGGCVGGVFMEYNWDTMSRATGPLWRDPKGDLASTYPCTEVEQQYRPACYFEQAAWWKATYQHVDDLTPQEATTAVAGLCSAVADPMERRGCFLGLGRSIATRGEHNLRDMIDQCSSIADDEGRPSCFEGAAWSTSIQPAHKDDWQLLCESLESGAQRACMQGPQLI